MSEASSNGNLCSSRCEEFCAVCGDTSTGYHYGVPSCNGCKSFFRRTLVSKGFFKCSKQGKCSIFKDARRVCRACRYKKCVEVGMNSNAIESSKVLVEPFALLYDKATNSMEATGRKILNASTSTDADPLQKDEDHMLSIFTIAEKIESLRTSVISVPLIFLDILTRPSALITRLPRNPSCLSATVSIDMEVFAILEFIKTFSWFWNLSFSEKYSLLQDKVPSLLALRLAWNRTRTAFHDQFSAFLSPIIDQIKDLNMDRTTMFLFSLLLLTENQEVSLSQEARIVATRENENYCSFLTNYLLQKHDVSDASRVAQHFFLLWSILKLGPLIRNLLKETESEHSLCQQILTKSI